MKAKTFDRKFDSGEKILAHRGRGMGIWSSFFFLGQFSSPWMVHQFDAVSGSMKSAFLVSGILGLSGGLVALASASFVSLRRS